MGTVPVSVFVVAVFVSVVMGRLSFVNGAAIPSTVDGPFKPVTVPLDKSFRGHAVDLPDNDPRVQRIVTGWEPEQIFVSLSSTHDSVWISWITGLFLPLSLSFFLTKTIKYLGTSISYHHYT